MIPTTIFEPIYLPHFLAQRRGDSLSLSEEGLYRMAGPSTRTRGVLSFRNMSSGYSTRYMMGSGGRGIEADEAPVSGPKAYDCGGISAAAPLDGSGYSLPRRKRSAQDSRSSKRASAFASFWRENRRRLPLPPVWPHQHSQHWRRYGTNLLLRLPRDSRSIQSRVWRGSQRPRGLVKQFIFEISWQGVCLISTNVKGIGKTNNICSEVSISF